ncbi:hypothetical protein EVAR_44143_1 [Eumeta japonica]|uniref:Uncharacterized protein n=1 Tax=Eumeta variegata TaxID=151549 RepID=A0A4C1XLR9_EUMVA|nr:hypothetical protein EVAR_44143_1 [Eumeta japonica]
METNLKTDSRQKNLFTLIVRSLRRAATSAARFFLTKFISGRGAGAGAVCNKSSVRRARRGRGRAPRHRAARKHVTRQMYRSAGRLTAAESRLY